MGSPWHVGVGKYSVQTCSHRQCQGYFWILLPCRTCVNPCSGVDMLSMSKQPQVATKTCPFRGVKRKKRRRCWKIATLWLSCSWTGDLSLWKHAMRRHPSSHKTVTWSQQGISSLLAKYLLSTSKALSARQTNYQFLFDLEKAENLQIACEIAQTEAAPDLYINMWAWGFNGFNKPFEHVALRQCWQRSDAPMRSKCSMACFIRHPVVGPSNAQKAYHNFSSLQFGQPTSYSSVFSQRSIDGDIHSEVHFCVHGSESLYHIVGAPIWAANAPRSLCESRSKLGSRLFDRCSIGVETDDLQLLLGFWPCLIDRESQQSHVQRFPTTHNSLVLVFCLCSPRVLKTARLAWSRDMSRFVPLVPFFFPLDAAFICLQPLILCFLQPILSKRSSLERFWKARIYAVVVSCTPGWKIMKE